MRLYRLEFYTARVNRYPGESAVAPIMSANAQKRCSADVIVDSRSRSIMPGRRLAESPLADNVKRSNILCAAVMVPFQTMDAVASKRAYPSRRRQ